ncbi:MaoC family dehydratase [Conexibacter sp. CPCC 206217]|uniref:MaoC family dehydratase n=1 Tax=Conexibacter sp. CPCC 206217 TaxID=3064574 RepID=UPI00272774A5|nr:MaoC family dehydratase [Conexibacter sp. CPCC 206217]MDO8212216.1 MaoC family dehydratase [Conexibacter sp. CPCC 206217]
MSSLVGHDNFFEDFVVGDRFRHARGKTVTELETMTLAQLVMNTSDGHFNADRMQHSEFGAPLAFGGVVAAIVYGLASQDTAEQAIEELGFERIRFPRPTVTGDTLYAQTEVLEREERDDASGTVRFRHLGLNADGETVCELERRVLLRRRPREGT